MSRLTSKEGKYAGCDMATVPVLKFCQMSRCKNTAGIIICHRGVIDENAFLVFFYCSRHNYYDSRVFRSILSFYFYGNPPVPIPTSFLVEVKNNSAASTLHQYSFHRADFVVSGDIFFSRGLSPIVVDIK